MDVGGVAGTREGCRGEGSGWRLSHCGPKQNMPLHTANMGRVWLALHKEQPLDGRMYSSVSQYVRGIPACSGLLVGARCLGGLFYSILFYSSV